MTRLFLLLNAILFIGFGIYVFLSAPGIFENMGFGELGTNALYEVRSNYGGVSLGIGLLCASGALKTQFERPALFTLMAYTGGYAMGRIIALPYEGTPSSTLIAYAFFEAITAIIAFLLLKRKSGKPST
ncbi:DUF4345 domain-containing protein [Hellea balneolensis]|uniref:DUF4345 domain-containing protein n=1 Tax=Hellea balneolensis TaxID=287478 RepID=UPI0004184139|nr:DUF4345 domain-containing protein [Hellea balneolensis]